MNAGREREEGRGPHDERASHWLLEYEQEFERFVGRPPQGIDREGVID